MDFDAVVASLERQKFEEARSRLYSIRTQNKGLSWERERQHLLAQSFLVENRSVEALSVLDQLFHLCGPNVNALADLALCYQNLKYWRDFELSVAVLDSEFRSLSGQLSYESRVKTRLRLGRFHEELGHLDRALELYQDEAVNFLAGPDDAIGVRLLARRLRLLAMLKNLSTETESLYRVLTRLDNERTHDILRFEVLRALILSENLIKGPSHAVARVVESYRASSTTITESEKLKIVFELIVQMAAFGARDDCLALQAYAEDRVTDDSPFERAVFDLVFLGQRPEFSVLSERLHPSRLLRLVFLTLRLAPPLEPLELDQLLSLRRHLLNGLSTASQNLWVAKFPEPIGPVKKIQLKLDRPLGMLICGERQASLSSSKLALRFASLFLHQEGLTFEAISQQLWGVQMRGNFVRRIRATVLRLNRICFDLTGASHCWGIDNDAVLRKVPLELV